MIVLDTPRLSCIPLREEHADVMLDVLRDRNLYHHIDDHPPESVDALRRRYRFLEKGVSPDGLETWLNWIIFLKAGNQPIGFYQATVRADHASIAYVLGSRFWRLGLAEEAGKAVLRHLFDNFAIDEIRAEIGEGNEASINLVRRLSLSFKEHDVAANELVFSLARSRYRV